MLTGTRLLAEVAYAALAPLLWPVPIGRIAEFVQGLQHSAGDATRPLR